jgi:PPM family protein phosphatase
MHRPVDFIGKNAVKGMNRPLWAQVNTMRYNSFAITDIGLKRKINQDAFMKDDSLLLYVVADGMGGHRGGEVASRVCVETIQKFAKENRNLSGREILDKGINMGCREIYRQSQEHDELSGMGTTVMALLFQADVAYIGQVGDSRAYLLNDSGIWQVTEDHSLLNEEIRAGRIAAGEAASYQFKNVITRSVGYENQVLVDVYRRKVRPGDMYVLCTDGLSGLVEINEFAEHLSAKGPERGLRDLVNLANSRGGDDNITALACQVVAD